MSLLTKKKYSFTSTGMDKETFTVVSFKGFEAISKPYKFDVLLVSEDTNIDPLKVLQNPAVFTIHRDEEDDVKFNGILMQFEETQEFDGYLFFKAVLAPKFWWLSLTHHNQVFLELSVPEIIEHALKDGGLNPGVDFSFNLINQYQPHEYICQYDESHFNFASRCAEREGIYYFFEQTPTGEKIIFTDSKMEHKDLLLGKDLIYMPLSGLDSLHTKEVVQGFICKHNMLPQKVYLKDYNYLKPSFSIEGMADVDENGRGENYVYGVHFDTPEDGNRLAQIRAEALICRKSVFHGESSVPFIVPGYTFDLNDHYRDVYNRKYLVSEVTHEGHQAGYLISGLTPAIEPRDEQMFYSNTFTSIYSDEQFRAEHLSEKPKISGTINAKIDASGSGEHAELDEYGRYKVILPFDRSGRSGGKASAFFRMMQPSAGQNQGMHFPLHKGTEVLLTFIDGNPDRPVIAGAMPNPETSSPVTDENQTKSIIRTGRSPVDHSVGAASVKSNLKKIKKNRGNIADNKGDISEIKNNFIELDDGAGNERIIIHSDGDLWFEARDRYTEYTIGGPADRGKVLTEVQYLWDKFNAASPDFAPTGMQVYGYASVVGAGTTASTTDISSMQNLAKKGKVKLVKGDTFNTQEGNIYDFGGYWNYNLGNCYVEEHLDQQAALNTITSQDLLDVGGPDWTEVDWDKAVGPPPVPDPNDDDLAQEEAIEADDLKIGGADDWEKGTAAGSSTNVWVNKQYGRSYSYSEVDSIDVNKGDTLNIKHVGKDVDVVFRGSGKIKSWIWAGNVPTAEKDEDGNDVTVNHYTVKQRKWGSDGRLTLKSQTDAKTGITTETKWNKFTKQMMSDTAKDLKSGVTSVHKYCQDTGNEIAYSSVHQGANSVHSFNFNWANTAKASFNFAAGAAFSFNASEQFKIAMNISASQSLNLSLAGDIKLNFKGGFNADFTFPLLLPPIGLISFKMDMSGLAMSLDGSGFSAKAFGVDLKAKKTSADIVAEGLLKIDSTHQFKLAKKGIDLAVIGLDLKM